MSACFWSADRMSESTVDQPPACIMRSTISVSASESPRLTSHTIGSAGRGLGFRERVLDDAVLLVESGLELLDDVVRGLSFTPVLRDEPVDGPLDLAELRAELVELLIDARLEPVMVLERRRRRREIRFRERRRGLRDRRP